jgi:hypothetical protein
MKLILCLTCGAKLGSEQEAIDHNEKYKRLEEETRWNLYGSTRWVNGRITGANPADYVNAHVVQISDTRG